MQYVDILKTSESKINFLKGLIRISKADGIIEPEEQMFFRAAGSQLALNEEELKELDGLWIKKDLPIEFTTMQEKMLFLREALQLCAVDGRYPEEEKAEIWKISEELQIPAETVCKLEEWVEEGMRWRERGDEFLDIK